MQISFNAHKNQTDKSGVPHVFHPFHLAEQMDDEYSVCVALLHDVAEDTDITVEQLRETKFPKEVVEAISAMTHPDGMPYREYIENIRCSNAIAVRVKLADLKHNSNLSRINCQTEKDYERVQKYAEAMQILAKTGK